jgi:four helix bundle protein
MLIKEVEDLAIYRIASGLATEARITALSIPYHWNNKDCSQITRSAASVPANIAEGFAHRFYKRQFIRYLTIALGSSDETQHHFKKLRNDQLIKEEIADNYIRQYKNLSVRIVNFINYLKKT